MIKHEVKAEDWENACHDLLWEKGQKDLFSRIAALARRHRDARVAVGADVGAETADQLLTRLVTQGGAIVSSSECSPMEIADARARGDFYVDADGLGYVLRLKKWLDLVKQRETALHSIAKNTCCDCCQEAALVAQTALAAGANVGAGETSPEKSADTSNV
jgi:hypothetical protein